jgi:hypothetical protein
MTGVLGGEILVPTVFHSEARTREEQNPTNVLQKINPYNISHIVVRLLQLLLDVQTFLVGQKHVLTSYHGQQGGFITKSLETDRDPTKMRNMTDHGK